MSFLLSVICSLSIGIAGLIAALRFGSIHPVYRPFIYYTWLAVANELLSTVMAKTIHSTAVNGNIYVLCEALLLVFQFRKWGLFERYRFIYYALMALLGITWLLENLVIYNISQFSSWFRIEYSFILVLLSISILNRQILGDKGPLLKNPVALICMAFIIFYTYKVLFETFWLYGLSESRIFQSRIYMILNYINLFSNLIFALAVLWMPIKHRFTTPSSSAVPS